MISDSACGYAALAQIDVDAAVLPVEFKLNHLRPAAGTHFRVLDRVVRSGRTLTVCQCNVYASQGSQETAVALLQATIMRVRGRGIED